MNAGRIGWFIFKLVKSMLYFGNLHSKILTKEHVPALKNLQKNNKTNKDFAVVIMNQKDYVYKIFHILNGTSGF